VNALKDLLKLKGTVNSAITWHFLMARDVNVYQGM